MLWLKAFHIVFVVTWFAGLFYLPRLFVYHAAAARAEGETERLLAARFAVMERRLFVIMTIGGALALLFGIALVASAPAYLRFGWLHVKLVLVGLLIVYHGWCHGLMKDLRSGRAAHADGWYRAFNEVPSVLLIAIVILAVVKPF
ncbi:MAG TPA: protoporphyrinogen oxidase HemJ [Steroidobacteraceae bacterium]|nr:protoporphyrinogen oxidase HemJ [Steroidobacteraceae bacterium]